MAVLRLRDRAADVIQATLEGLAHPEDVVEWEVCSAMAEVVCDGDGEPHASREQVLCVWVGLSCPESDATSTCQWMMPMMTAANDDFLAESVTETWHNLMFTRRAHELDKDLDLDELARHLDDGDGPG